MIIRAMTPSDAKQVAEIEAQCFSVPWSEQSFLDSIAREDTVFLVAELSGAEEVKNCELDRAEETETCKSDKAGRRQMTAVENERCCVKTASRTIAGYIGMYLSFEEGEITNVAVASEYRKKGIGNALVTAMQLAGKEHHLERIVLEVRASNERALSLYKRKGFVELGIRKNFYEKPTEDAIIMSCDTACVIK